MRTLIVVDMLNDFIKKDGALYGGPTSEAIVPFVKQKIDDVHSERGRVIYIADAHDPDDKEFERFPKHCVHGSDGAQVIDELPMKKGDLLLRKTRYSGFYNTDLSGVLERIKADQVEIVGVCTSICVMDTVGGLANRDYDVTVWKDGVADFDQENHAFALKRMERLYGAKVK